MEDLSTCNPSDEALQETVVENRRHDGRVGSPTNRLYKTRDDHHGNELQPRRDFYDSVTSNAAAIHGYGITSPVDSLINHSNPDHRVSKVSPQGPLQLDTKDTNAVDNSGLRRQMSEICQEEKALDTAKNDDISVAGNTYTAPLLHSRDEVDIRNASNHTRTPSKRPLAKSDSLPHHRERLGQKRTTLTSPDEGAMFRGETEQDSLLIYKGDSSSATNLRRKTQPHLRKTSPKRCPSSCPQEKSFPRVHRDRGLGSSSHQIDSWFGDQNYDYIDACYAEQTRRSQSSQSLISSGLKPYVRRDEIAFGAPTPRDITFNVSGQYYRIDADLLAKYPDTLLGNREKRAKFWDASRKEYFLDKHKATFEVIIDYYVHNGALNRPDDIPIDIFINEIKFYCLDRENLVKFLSAEGILLVEKEKEMPDTETKKYIWNLFEDPESCKVARIVTTMSAMVIAISIVVFCMETVPRYESLGHESLKHIEPALMTCQLHLCNEKKYYQPNGTLFSAIDTDGDNDTLLCSHSKPAAESVRSTTSSSDTNTRRHSRSAHPPTTYQSVAEFAAGTQYDDFDGSVLLSTMTEALTICSQNGDFPMLSRYTYLRCKSELNDYADNPQPLLETLGELEFHDQHDEKESVPLQTTSGSKFSTSFHNLSPFPNSSYDPSLFDNENSIDNSSIGKRGEAKRNGKSYSKRQSEVATIFNQHPIKPSKHHRTNSTEKRHKSRKSHRNGHKRSTHLSPTMDAPSSNTEQKLMTLRQTIRGLIQLCHKLDNKSVRSSYHWLALEATLGGAAGQLFLIESGCIVWFVIEICLRFYSCPNKKKFCTDFLNVIDAIAIMPYFITLIVTSLHTDSNLRPQTATILRTIRLVRMLRILKLSRHSRGLRILGLTLVRSTRVLVLLICFQMVLAVTFSSIVYYVEYDAPDTKFKSIPSSFWWAIITMTTVGYGDVVPVTTLGKITGAFCAIMGILGIAFPVPVIVSNFNYLYNLDSDACKITPEELMEDEEENDNDRNNNVEKFQENLFDAVRKNVGSMTSAPQEGQPTGQNPAELWNYTRRQYFSNDKKSSSKSSDPASKQKFTKGIVAMATASALTVGLANSDAFNPKNFNSKGDKPKTS